MTTVKFDVKNDNFILIQEGKAVGSFTKFSSVVEKTNIPLSEFAAAVDDMIDNNHPTAHFGVLGTFLYSE